MTWRICKVFILSGLLALSFSVKSKAIGKVAGKIGDADIEFLLWQANIECFHPYFAFMVQPFFAAQSLHHLEDQMCINNCVSDSMSPEIRKEVTRRLSDFYLRLDNEKISGFPLPGGLNTMRPGCGASKNYIDLANISSIKIEYGRIGEGIADKDSPVESMIYLKDINLSKEV